MRGSKFGGGKADGQHPASQSRYQRKLEPLFNSAKMIIICWIAGGAGGPACDGAWRGSLAQAVGGQVGKDTDAGTMGFDAMEVHGMAPTF